MRRINLCILAMLTTLFILTFGCKKKPLEEDQMLSANKLHLNDDKRLGINMLSDPDLFPSLNLIEEESILLVETPPIETVESGIEFRN